MTDLNSPVWEPVVIVHDQETPVVPASLDGNRLILNGAAFNYPEPVPVKLRIVMKGSVPANHTANQTLLDIRQIDSGGIPYAWPSGNFTLPMPGVTAGNVPETGATTVPATVITLPPHTMPATLPSVSPESSPPATGTNPEKTLILPTPLPATVPKKAAQAGLPEIAGAAAISVYLGRRTSGR